MMDILSKPLGTRYRGAIAFGAGEATADVINGVSLITRGEALGHDLWVDAEFLADMVAKFPTELGLKSRFTHPSLSSDGLGAMLGKFKNPRPDGDRVIADLHFSDHAHHTPDGDLADYVSRLAAEDPEHFGTSIVFDRDTAAEKAFMDANRQGGTFVSPDPRNRKNLPHARLAKLKAADVVDTPAANPDGLFYVGQDIAAEAESLLKYSLGLTDEAPKLTALSVDTNRFAAFIKRTLANNKITLSKGPMPQTELARLAESLNLSEDVVKSLDALSEADLKTALSTLAGSDTADEPETAELAEQADTKTSLQEFVNAFGHENGSKLFLEGKSFNEAATAHIETLNAKVSELTEALAEKDKVLAAASLGETALDTASEDAPEKPSLASMFNIKPRTAK